VRRGIKLKRHGGSSRFGDKTNLRWMARSWNMPARATKAAAAAIAGSLGGRRVVSVTLQDLLT